MVLSWTAHVQVATVVLYVVLVPGSAGMLHGAPQHPNLFVNVTELVQLRAKLETEPWRAKLLEQVEEDADAGNPVAAAVVYALTVDRAYGEKVRGHLVQQAKSFVPGRPGAQYPWGPEAGSAIAFDLAAPLLTADEQRAVVRFLRQLARDAIKYHAGQPLTPTLGDFHWACLQNPGLSPGCVLLLTPRQPAEWSHRPANVSAFWPLRDGESFFLVFGTEDTLRSLAEEAIRAP